VKIVGWPGDDRSGILLMTKKEFPACGGGMRRTFALKRALNRPHSPACPTSLANANSEPVVGLWGVMDG